MDPITYGVVEQSADLLAIQQLQSQNLPLVLSESEASQQGFVTIRHDLDLLTEMNHPYPHIVARDADELIGYTLVMQRRMANRIDLLIPMFAEIDATVYQGRRLEDTHYVVMGQVCIAKDYRGRGVFAGLYEEMRRRMATDFEYIITEVSVRNGRSMRAHEKVGFQNIKQYRAGGDDWVILLLDIR